MLTWYTSSEAGTHSIELLVQSNAQRRPSARSETVTEKLRWKSALGATLASPEIMAVICTLQSPRGK